MHEIDKVTFGAFVSQLRKEQGLTQKELAAKVYVTDKAVSKWETGVSIPDVTVLMPLAEALGVTVTELLECRRIPKEEPMVPQQVEELVKKAICCTEDAPKRPGLKKRALIYALCLAISLGEIALLHLAGHPFDTFPVTMMLGVIFGVVFGAYFMLVVTNRLPDYYDQNRIGFVHQYGFKMNLPGICFNNHNWPYIVRVGRVWSMTGLLAYPALYGICLRFLPEAVIHSQPTQMVLLVVLLMSLFLPLYVVGIKFEN